MKIVSIANEDTNIMMGLLGIEGYEIKTQDPTKFKKKFDKILEDEKIGIILMNEKFLIRYKSYFKSKKLEKTPIIVEIPDMKAPLKSDYVEDLIEKFLGLKI